MKASASKNSDGLKTLLSAMMVIGSMVALQGCSDNPLGPQARADLGGDGIARTELPAAEVAPTPSMPELPIDKDTGQNPAKAD